MRRPLVWLGVFLAFIFLILELISAPPETELASILNVHNDEPVSVTGRVKSVSSDSFILKNISVNKQKISYNLTIEYESPVKPGQWIYLRGNLHFYEAAMNEGEFDKLAFNKASNIAGFVDTVEFIKHGEKYNHLAYLLMRFRESAEKRILKIYDPLTAGAVQAILTGDKSGVDRKMKNLFRESGIIHVFSVSGMHISILGNGLYFLLKKMKRDVRIASLMSGLFMLIYAAFTGFSVSSVRACGCFLISAPAILLRRSFDPLSALAFMEIVLLIINPHLILNTSFILSYASVLGVHLVFGVLKPNGTGYGHNRLYKFLFGLYSSFVLGVSIFISTLPIILSLYYEFSPWSVIINLVVVPCMSVFMVIALISLIPCLGFVSAINVYITEFLLFLSEKTTSLPGGLIITGAPARIKIVVYYILLAALLILYKKKSELWQIRVAVLLLIPFLIFGNGERSVNFLYAGQGDAAVLLDGSEAIIIDAGSGSTSKLAENTLIPFLKCHGVKRVKAVFLSHSDKDHTNGIETFIKNNGRIEVEYLCLPGGRSKSIMDFSSVLGNKPDDVKVIECKKGDVFSFGGLEIEVLAPSENVLYKETNEGSMVLLVKDRTGRNILFTGDTENLGETELASVLRSRKINVDVLKVSHHGSRNSTGKAFLEASSPDFAVISCPVISPYGHPHAETLERLGDAHAIVYRTDKCGQVKMKFKKKGIKFICNDKTYNP